MILAHLLGLKELKLLAAPIGSETNLWPSPLQQGGNMASEVILPRVVPQHISRLRKNMQQTAVSHQFSEIQSPSNHPISPKHYIHTRIHDFAWCHPPTYAILPGQVASTALRRAWQRGALLQLGVLGPVTSKALTGHSGTIAKCIEMHFLLLKMHQHQNKSSKVKLQHTFSQGCWNPKFGKRIVSCKIGWIRAQNVSSMTTYA